jgi:hypothetical protein
VATIVDGMKVSGRANHVLIIANLLPNKSKVNLSAFRFVASANDPRKFEKGLIELVEEHEFSHDHQRVQDVLERLRAEQYAEGTLLDPEDKSLKGLPLPTANLQSTESTNVIDLV